MSVLSKILSWLRPAGSPEEEAEVERMRAERKARKDANVGNAAPAGIYAPVVPPEDDREH